MMGGNGDDEIDRRSGCTHTNTHTTAGVSQSLAIAQHRPRHHNGMRSFGTVQFRVERYATHR